MKVIVSQQAYDDLQHIEAWIEQGSPRSAARVIDIILSFIEKLSVFPRLGRATRLDETREAVVPRLPFIVIYRLDEYRDELFVVAVYHAARDRGPLRAGS